MLETASSQMCQVPWIQTDKKKSGFMELSGTHITPKLRDTKYKTKHFLNRRGIEYLCETKL